MFRRSKKAQSTAEYAIVIGLVIAAVVGMQVYVKRGIQGKMRDASDMDVNVDDITNNPNGDWGVNDAGDQYEPTYATTTNMNTTRDSTEKATTTVGGAINRQIVGDETTSRKGNTDILAP